MRRQQSRKPRKANNNNKMVIPHPIGRNTQLSHKVCLRFITNAAFAGNITLTNLLDAINMVTTATTASQLFTSVRIKRLQIWANALTNATTTLELSFEGGAAGNVGDFKMHSAMSMGIEPAYLNVRPDPRSQAAQFQTGTGGAVAWFMDIPTGAVVDAWLEYRNPLVGAGNAVTQAVAGGTVGQICLRGLDGLAIATTKFTPVGSTNVD